MQRLNALPDLHAPWVVCNEDHRFLVAEQLRELGGGQANIILEPVGRNTAPAVAVAAFAALEKDPNAILLVLPADHLIQQVDVFQRAVAHASTLAENDHLVTFGIKPTQAETGYGYIKAGEALTGETAYCVAQFVEKPDAETAQAYVDSGEYYWNSGMFVFKAQRYLDELKQFQPDMYTACERAFSALVIDIQRDFLRLDDDAFAACPSESIDYAVMEKTHAAAVVPLDAGWDDIGAWSSLWAVTDHDAAGNVILGDVISHNSHNSYIRAEHRLVATVGIDNLVVVETADAVLVAAKDQVQDVKHIVNILKEKQRDEVNLHRRVHRPWGSYEAIDAQARYQVKRIIVNPGASLSQQMHYHRSEHWIVVHGTAKVYRDGESFLLTENQSTYIPLGTAHRLENPGKLPLELIEVQSGSYLGEDDIVRFDDEYGR